MRFGLDPIRDVQVLCPMNRGSLGVRELNAALQRVLNPVRPGEPSVIGGRLPQCCLAAGFCRPLGRFCQSDRDQSRLGGPQQLLVFPFRPLSKGAGHIRSDDCPRGNGSRRNGKRAVTVIQVE